MKNSYNNLNSLPISINSSLQILTEKKPEDNESDENLNSLEPIDNPNQDDPQLKKDPTMFGDWQINCRTIDF